MNATIYAYTDSNLPKLVWISSKSCIHNGRSISVNFWNTLNLTPQQQQKIIFFLNLTFSLVAEDQQDDQEQMYSWEISLKKDQKN